MDDLVTWLRAQLDDDERAARAWLPLGNPTAADREHVARHDPARVLAEVDAKRRIVAWLEDAAGFDLPATKTQAMSREEWHQVMLARTTIKLLAVPYVHREGYREEWRP